ncbi:MAG: lipid A biosynthesis acyltransferase, partial [Planctomycetaceae bacterium]|nr:lipid A biosynthesis acyltransferase [Planctomycetaceae bacterium]
RHYTEIWVKALEEEIRKCPEQYFWVHRRWKSQPRERKPKQSLETQNKAA